MTTVSHIERDNLLPQYCTQLHSGKRTRIVLRTEVAVRFDMILPKLIASHRADDPY
jgi:hypothetical protein